MAKDNDQLVRFRQARDAFALLVSGEHNRVVKWLSSKR